MSTGVAFLVVGLVIWAASQAALAYPLLRYNPPQYPGPVVWLCWPTATIGGALAGSGIVQVVWW
jgi:hypothetical protein